MPFLAIEVRNDTDDIRSIQIIYTYYVILYILYYITCYIFCRLRILSVAGPHMRSWVGGCAKSCLDHLRMERVETALAAQLGRPRVAQVWRESDLFSSF